MQPYTLSLYKLSSFSSLFIISIFPSPSPSISCVDYPANNYLLRQASSSAIFTLSINVNTQVQSPIMSRSTQKWTPEVHEDILLAYVKVSKLTPPQMGEVMTELTAKGYTFTDGALK